MEDRNGERTNDTFLFQQGDFLYHVVTKEYRDQVLVAASRALCSSPVSEMNISFLDWIEYLDSFMDNCSVNGISVMALDIASKRVAGTLLVHRSLTSSDAIEKTFSNEEKDVSAVHQITNLLYAKGHQHKPELNQREQAADLFMLGVLPDFRGNKIGNNLVKAALLILKKTGFKYAECGAGSTLTEKILDFNAFELVCKVEAKNYKWKGKPLLALRADNWSFWIKALDSV